MDDDSRNAVDGELECSGPLISKEKTEPGYMLLPLLEQLPVGQKRLLAVAWVPTIMPPFPRSP